MAKLVLLLVFVCFQKACEEILTKVGDLQQPQQLRDGLLDFQSEELPAIEQIKLDLDDDVIPFTNQTAPDEVLNGSTAELDGSEEDLLNPGPKFNYDWLEEKLSSSDVELNKTDNKTLSVLEKLIALAELIADYSSEEDSFDWDALFDDDEEDDYSDYSDYSDMSKDWSYTAEYKESLKGKNGKEYIYNSIISLLKPKNSKDDKIGQNWSNGKIHPVKRFTSV